MVVSVKYREYMYSVAMSAFLGMCAATHVSVRSLWLPMKNQMQAAQCVMLKRQNSTRMTPCTKVSQLLDSMYSLAVSGRTCSRKSRRSRATRSRRNIFVSCAHVLPWVCSIGSHSHGMPARMSNAIHLQYLRLMRIGCMTVSPLLSLKPLMKFRGMSNTKYASSRQTKPNQKPTGWILKARYMGRANVSKIMKTSPIISQASVYWQSGKNIGTHSPQHEDLVTKPRWASAAVQPRNKEGLLPFRDMLVMLPNRGASSAGASGVLSWRMVSMIA
mmetsp:Transcript_3731/g.11404  ORF Transcript_3731/g.11404 Transcript_3731/m.11404 type:complete len:273 (+) Transcript_3731:1457-2275(+)